MKLRAHGSFRASVAKIREGARSSLLLVPLLLIALSVVASVVTLAVDARFDGELGSFTIFHAGAEGARATLSTIAGSVMTVGGVSFSITIVVLQLASTQFSPRVVRGFMRSRLVQVVLGAYMATFTYALLVLRRVASGDRRDAFVPNLSITVALVLAVCCMVLLAVFIHHVARSVQVPAIIGLIVDEALDAARELYPEPLGEASGDDVDEATGDDDGAAGDDILAPAAGYLEYVDDHAFSTLPHGAEVRIRLQTGEFAHEGDVVARVLPAGTLDDDARREIAGAFSFYAERTVRQDVAFAIRMVADVAVRALSPGINDPTTALYCIDANSRILHVLAGRRFPDPVRVRPENDVRVVAPRPDYGELLRCAFVQVLHYGRDDLVVLEGAARALASLSIRSGDRATTAFASLFSMIEEAVARSLWPKDERERVLHLIGAAD